MPADYSLVVWSSTQSVNIEHVGAVEGEINKFPNFPRDPEAKLRDFNGNVINNPGENFDGKSCGLDENKNDVAPEEEKREEEPKEEENKGEEPNEEEN